MTDQAGYGARPQDDPYEGRRQFYELTAEELRAQPAWWFPGSDGHLTGPDTATLMPVELEVSSGPVEFPAGRYLLRAVFTLADGTTVDGHVTYTPGDSGTLADREPTLCGRDCQVTLWYGVLVPTERERAAALDELGRERGAVFPLRWRSVLHPPDGPLEGVVDGFAVLLDDVVSVV